MLAMAMRTCWSLAGIKFANFSLNTKYRWGWLWISLGLHVFVIIIHPEGDKNVCTKFHGNPINGQTFQKSKMSSSRWRYRKSQGVIRVIRVHHLGTIIVMNAIPSSRCWDISEDKWRYWTTGGAIEKVRGSPQWYAFHFWGPLMSVQKFVVTHPIVFEINH